MKKISIIILCIAMALLFAVVSPMQLAAGSKQKYISELKMAYGTTERDALVKAGYKSVKDNVNKGNSVEVYLCYKTTENKDEAICDISMMNMSGNYSYADYEAMLKSKRDAVATLVTTFKTTINEFVANYNKQTPSAVAAFKVLNKFYDDDTAKTLGNLFVEGATDAQLETLFLESNSNALTAVESLLALGCKDVGDSFIDRLKKSDIDGEYNENLYSLCEMLAASVQYVQKNINAYKDTWDEAAADAVENGKITTEAELTEELYSEYLNTLAETSKTMATKAASGFALYKITKDIRYASSDMTLYDVLCTDIDEIANDSETILYLFAPLADSLTEGQAAALSAVGIDTLIYVAVTDNDAIVAKCDEQLAEIEKTADTVSMYVGVDRTIYSATGVALTTAANTETYANENYEWVETGDKYADTIERLTIAGAVFAVVTALACIIIIIKIVNFIVDAAGEGEMLLTFLGRWLKYSEWMTWEGSTTLNSGAFALIFVAVLALITTAIFLIRYFLQKYKLTKKKFVDYTYTDIPRILVDYVDGNEEEYEDGYYLYYYAVTKADGTLGDLNGWDNKTNKYWNALYYCKDSRAGAPITENFLLSTSNITPDGMVGVHDFEKGVEGVKSAVNLNQSSKAQDTAIYLYYTPYVESTKTASVFSSSVGMVCAFVLGIVLTAGAEYVMTRKKKVTENA